MDSRHVQLKHWINQPLMRVAFRIPAPPSDCHRHSIFMYNGTHTCLRTLSYLTGVSLALSKRVGAVPLDWIPADSQLCSGRRLYHRPRKCHHLSYWSLARFRPHSCFAHTTSFSCITMHHTEIRSPTSTLREIYNQ